MARHSTRKSSRLNPPQRLSSPPPLTTRPPPPSESPPPTFRHKARPKEPAKPTTQLTSSPPASEPAPSIPRAKSTTNAPLIVVIDQPPQERTFTLNRTLITAHSKLLHRAHLEAPSADLAIALPGVRAIDFEAYVQYYGAVNYHLRDLAEGQWTAIAPPDSTLSPAEEIYVRVATLLGFWVMGSILEDVDFQNAVVDALMEEDLRGEAGAAVVQSAGVILSNTAQGSGLSRLLLDVMAPMVTEEFVEEWGGRWSKELTVELLKRVLRVRTGEMPTVRDRERYYEVETDMVNSVAGDVE